MSGLRAEDVVRAVRRHYGAESDSFGPEWALLDEFVLQPGSRWTNRIDLLAIRAWRGQPKGHERHAIEVKVSRSDLAAELAHPEKSAPFRAITHRFYFATPAGLVRPTDELPDGWGLLEVTGDGVRKTRQGAGNPRPDPMPAAALVEAFRRASRAEARIRDGADDDPAATIARLHRELASAHRSTDTARAATDRAERRATRLAYEIARFMPVPCVCGKSDVRLVTKPGRAYSGLYKHVSGDDCTSPCPHYERVAAGLEAESA